MTTMFRRLGRRGAGFAAAAALPMGLAVAALVFSAPASAQGNKTLQVEQLGPKFLLGAGSTNARQTVSTNARETALTTRPILITFKTLEVEELGPKYLLGR